MKKLLLGITTVIVLFGGAYAQPPRHPEIPIVLSSPEQAIQHQVIYGDGRHDDTAALNAWGHGERVFYKGRLLGNVLENGIFVITWQVEFRRPHSVVRHNKFIWRYRGYDRTDWIVYGKRVRQYENEVVDIGMGPPPPQYRRIHP